jgi:hypothetical protein
LSFVRSVALMQRIRMVVGAPFSCEKSFVTVVFPSGASTTVTWPQSSVGCLEADALRAAHASGIVDVESAPVKIALLVAGGELTKLPRENPIAIRALLKWTHEY